MNAMNMCRIYYDPFNRNLIRASFEGEKVDASGINEPYYIHLTLSFGTDLVIGVDCVNHDLDQRVAICQ